MRRVVVSSLLLFMVHAVPVEAQASEPRTKGGRTSKQRGFALPRPDGAGAVAAREARLKALVGGFESRGQAMRGGARPSKSADVTGKVIWAKPAELLLERVVDESTARALVATGQFRSIGSIREARDRTVFGDRLYVLYELAYSAEGVLILERLAGRQVTLNLERDSAGMPRIVGVRQ